MVVERRIEEASSLRSFFHEQWQHLSRLISKRNTPAQDHSDLGAAVDMVVDGTDVRVRAVSGYKKQLRDVTRSLLEHIDSLVDDLPPPLELTRQNIIYDPQMAAYFNSMDKVRDVCLHSHEIMSFATSGESFDSDSFFALLLMHYSEKEMFGSEIKGDILHKDVKQTHVIFSGHNLLSPADSELNLRKGLKRLLFENVIQYLKLFLAVKRKEDMVGSSVAVSNFSFETLNNPSKYLTTLVKLLKMPVDLVRMSNNSIRIDSMGMKIPDGEHSGAADIQLQQFDFGGKYNYLIVLTKIPWEIVK